VAAARPPLRNVITSSLGSDPAPSPDVWVLPPTPGEGFVICSDGLSNELDDREIMLVTREHADPQVAADELVAAAVRAGGRDNVSVVVVSVGSASGD
jgi:PPM family protein phosphatase